MIAMIFTALITTAPTNTSMIIATIYHQTMIPRGSQPGALVVLFDHRCYDTITMIIITMIIIATISIPTMITVSKPLLQKPINIETIIINSHPIFVEQKEEMAIFSRTQIH